MEQALDSEPQIFTFSVTTVAAGGSFLSEPGTESHLIASLKLMLSCGCRSFLSLALSLKSSQMFAKKWHILSHTAVNFLVSSKICIKLNVDICHYSSQQSVYGVLKLLV